MRVVDNVYSIECPYFGPATAARTRSLVVHNTLLRVGYLLFLVVYVVTVLHWLDFVAKLDGRIRARTQRLLRPVLALAACATAGVYAAYFALLPRAGAGSRAYAAVDAAMLAYLSLCFLLCAAALLGASVALDRAVRRARAARLRRYARRVLALAAAASALLVVRTVWTVVLAVRDARKAAAGWPPALLVAFQLAELLPLAVLAALMWPAHSKRRLVRSALSRAPAVSAAGADTVPAGSNSGGGIYEALVQPSSPPSSSLPSPPPSPSPSPSPPPTGAIN